MLHTWKILAGRKINTFKKTKKTRKKRKGVQNWNCTMKNASFNQQALSLKPPPGSSMEQQGWCQPISPFPDMARKGTLILSAFQSFPHFSLRCGVHMHHPSVSMGCRKHCTAPTTCELNIEVNNQPRPQNSPKVELFWVILNTIPYLPGTPNNLLFWRLNY